MSFYKLLFIWIILLISFEAYAQETDSIIILKQTEVKAFRIKDNQATTRSTQQIKKIALTTYSTNTLNDLLSKNTNITINQYGVSGLSSVSMRGGNANHTAVLWNGFNLQDPLNGEFNLSLSSVNIIDKINIHYGGNSALFGSGAVGGIIQLSNKAYYNSGIKVSAQQSFGSFGKQTSLFDMSYGTHKLFLRTRVFYSSIKNDFEYVNFAKNDHPIDTLKRAAIKQYGFLQEAYYKINKKHSFNTQFWYQNNYREIPPNMTVTDGYSTQYDEFSRLAFAYNKKGEKLDLEIRNGLFLSKINYIKPDIILNVHHSSLNNVTEGIVNYRLTKHNSFLFGINNNYIKGESDNFIQAEILNKTAIFLSYKLEIKNKVLLTANIRKEVVNAVFKPITYGVKAEYFITKSLVISSNLSKNYRTPNFNDLFWIGAYARGNPDLKDEDGFSADLGLNQRINTNKLDLECNISAYYSKFSNLIKWQPIGDIWIPQNKKMVTTKGLEVRLNTKYQFTNTTIGFFNINYTYTDSELTQKAENESDNVLYKQLIYIPYYQANGLLGFQYKKIRADIIVQYVGQRYTSADNENWLDQYIVTDINLNYTFNYKKISSMFFAKANNIFNTQYMVREWYPTPLINYEIGLKIMYN